MEAFVGLKLEDSFDRTAKTRQTSVLVAEQEVSELSVAWGLRSVVVVVLNFGTSPDQRCMTSLDLRLYQSHRLVSSVWASLPQRCPLAAEL